MRNNGLRNLVILNGLCLITIVDQISGFNIYKLKNIITHLFFLMRMKQPRFILLIFLSSELVDYRDEFLNLDGHL